MSDEPESRLSEALRIVHEEARRIGWRCRVQFFPSGNDTVGRRARAARSTKKAEHIARARELKAEGLSAATIAVRMTQEQSQADARKGRTKPRPDIAARTVEKWLALAKPPAD